MRLFVLILVFVLLAVIPVKVETTLSKAVRRAFINSTNLVRSNVAMGKQLNSNGTFLPSAKNFYKLGYNIQLEAEAEKWVSNCVYTFPVVKNVAGNAVKIFGLQTINESLADKIVQTWLSSVARSGLQSLNLTARDNSTLRSFVQMTWGSVQEIGCAIKQCPSLRATLGVCLYSPANVKVGKLIYQKGAYCKKDADCTTHEKSKCLVSLGLCSSKPLHPFTTTTKAPTTVKPTTKSVKPSTAAVTKPSSVEAVTSTTKKPNVPVAQPTATPEESDVNRLIALHAHNNVRSIVARGQAINKNGTFLPNATNMNELTYSKLVESYAIEKANSCQWNHTYVNGTLNNLYAYGAYKRYADSAVALNNSVYSWYSELNTDGQSSLTLDNTNYNHFTEVIWANVNEIGCAVAKCPKMEGLDFGANYKYTFVVCNYNNGNILGQNIYEAGPSCSNCPSESTCNPDNKLCQRNGVPQIHD